MRQNRHVFLPYALTREQRERTVLHDENRRNIRRVQQIPQRPQDFLHQTVVARKRVQQPQKSRGETQQRQNRVRFIYLIFPAGMYRYAPLRECTAKTSRFWPFR